jgi:hypothetical protein
VEKGDQRIGRRPAELAAVLRPGERPHLDRHDRVPAKRDGERRDSGADVPAVQDHHRVGGELLQVGRILERAADLLLALDQDADGRPALPGTQRSDVGEDV